MQLPKLAVPAAALTVLGLAGALALGPASAAAPDAADQSMVGELIVEGSGEARVPAGSFEIRGVVSGAAEVAGDAHQKYVQARERVVAGIAAAGLEGVTISGQGPRLSYGPEGGNQQMGGMVFINGQMETPDQNVSFEEQLLLKVTANGLDGAARAALAASVLDAAMDAGMAPASGSSDMQQIISRQGRVTARSSSDDALFVLRAADPDAAEQAAFASAMQSARKRADGLAKLAGRSLGIVKSIEVTSTSVRSAQATGEVDYGAALRVVFELN